VAIDAWLPIGHRLPDGAQAHVALFGGAEWQIVETQGGGRALLVHAGLADRWTAAGLTTVETLEPFDFGGFRYRALTSASTQVLCPVDRGAVPGAAAQVMSFVRAFRATRDIDAESPLHDALYVERIGRLLPVYTPGPAKSDDLMLGYWLTGGMHVSVTSFRRLSQVMGWLAKDALKEAIEVAGYAVAPVETPQAVLATASGTLATSGASAQREAPRPLRGFELPGRPDLAAFFNEHVVDIVLNLERYRALGIEFPSAVILHGPPGCGKTFAVERLIDFLGWNAYHIDASSVASPFIHETSRKVAAVFDQAMENAPSVLVIDEMEAFLADREMGAGHHRVEEVAEFLRRIPEATKNKVLVIAMTNRLEMIDPAILRRGRFDHIVQVGFATEHEVLSLLAKLLEAISNKGEIDALAIARQLAGRPLSDVAFVVREGARLAARSGRDRLEHADLLAALHVSPPRDVKAKDDRRIGFV
jgi:hypothetical protein